MSVTDPLAAPPRSTTRTVVIATLALVFTFIAGFIAGAVTDRLLRWRRPGPPPFVAHTLLNRLDRQLDLTDAQRAEVRTILQRRHERMTEHWETLHPQIRTEIELANSEIEKLLTPEQRRKFEKIRMRLGPAMHPPGRGRTGSTR